ncbi:hypothetical protein D3C71_1733530 [compost metagenome]
MQQHHQADEAQHTEQTTGNHGQQLLLCRADEVVIDHLGCQQADEVAGEDEQHADVEQVAGDAHVALVGRGLAEQLAGACLPAVLRQVEARPAADQADGQGDVRVDPEHQQVDVRHCVPPEPRLLARPA